MYFFWDFFLIGLRKECGALLTFFEPIWNVSEGNGESEGIIRS